MCGTSDRIAQLREAKDLHQFLNLSSSNQFLGRLYRNRRRASRMESFNETELTTAEPVPREMTPRRAVFLMTATLLLWCGTMLLVLDLVSSAAHGGPALIGLVLVAIGGSCLWADFFEVTSWFVRERSATAHVPHIIHAAFLPKVLYKRGASADQENSQSADADEGD